MTCPSPNSIAPLTAAPLPLSSLESSTTLSPQVLSSLISQAFANQRSSSTWSKGKIHKTEVGNVQIYKGSSGQKGKFAKCAWHGRFSEHQPSTIFDLTYAEFREGLLLNHAPQEAQYIHDCVDAKLVRVLRPGIAEVWVNSYHLPSIASNRDFCELLLTLDLPDHAEPFSEAHEALTISAYSDPEATFDSIASQSRAQDGAEGGEKRKSFIVIQLPVTTELCGERTKESYVRASYASVEAVQERKDGSIEWNMFVQSNVGGSIPFCFQEMAMPNKIHPDVPYFILWAKDNLESRKK